MGPIIGFVLGVVWCAQRASLPDGWTVIAGLVLLGFWRRFAPPPVAWCLQCAFAVLLGLGYAGWQAGMRLADALPAAWAGRPVTVVAVLRDLPRRDGRGTVLQAEVERVDTAGARVPRRIRLHATGGVWPAGSRWRLTVVLQPSRALANRYGFDAEAWAWAQGLRAQGRVLGRPQRLADGTDGPSRLDRLRERLAARIDRALGSSRGAALVIALSIGDQRRLDAEAWRVFAATGITHLVSISGLHVGLIAALASACAGWLLRRRPPARLTPRSCRVAVAIAAAAGYALLAGWSVPTRRTLFLLAVGGLLLVWRRALPPMRVWWLALAAVLLFDPFAVFFPGLWLSFGLVAALMLPTLGRCRPPGRWQGLALAQWSATVWSLPLLAWFFSALPPVSPLANALAIPWVSLLLTPLALAGAVLPFDGLLRLADWLAEGLFRGAALLAAVPVWIVPAPSLPVLVAALVGAAWLTLPAGLPGRAIGVLLLVPLVWGSGGRPPPGEAHVTVIDVGQGLAVLVRTARHALLYDTGAPATAATVAQQLAGAGIRRLDVMVLSHHDADHDGAAAALLATVPVTRLLAGQPGSIPAGIPGTACAAGMHWRWDDVAFDMLAPLPGAVVEGDNAASCVLRIAAAGSSLLLTGDIPRAVEQRLVASLGPGLASTVLLVPHHGSRTSSSTAFLRAVQPAFAVVSAGYRNRYRHPHPAVLADYRAHGIALWRTDRDGAVDLVLGRTVTLNGRRQAAPRYWRSVPVS